jgi:hypothetical protein
MTYDSSRVMLLNFSKTKNISYKFNYLNLTFLAFLQTPFLMRFSQLQKIICACQPIGNTIPLI